MSYDVIIVGSGPAGISASLYTKRANLNTLIITKEESSLEKATKIENYYGFENGISGKELVEQGIKQAKNLGIEIVKDEVVKIEKQAEGKFYIETINGSYEAKRVILATGTTRKTPNIRGIKEFEGKGVSYCATCDAFFFKKKDVAVLGSGNYAIHEAKELSKLVNSVTIMTNGNKIIENRENLEPNMSVEEKEISEFRGIDSIEEVEFADNTRTKINGVFVALGTASSSDLARKIGAKIDNNNNIVVDEKMQTTVKGLYACGDCTGGLLQIAKAVHEGCVAGISAVKQ